MSTSPDLVLVSAKLGTSSPLKRELIDQSLFLKYVFKTNVRQLLGQSFGDLEPDTSGNLFWDDLEPQDGTFAFELATTVPFFLPEYDGPDYCLSIGDSDVIVSNNFVLAYCGSGYPVTESQEYIITHRARLPDLHKQVGEPLHLHPLRSFVSKQYSGTGTSAHDVLERKAFKWAQDLIDTIAKLGESFRLADPKQGAYIDASTGISAYPLFWLSCVGSNNEPRCVQFSGDLSYSAYLSRNLVSEEGRKIVRDVLSGNIDVPSYHSALSIAHAHLHHGRFAQAVVDLSVACESALSLCLRKFLLERGVSESTLEDMFSNITYSQLLNFHLFSMIDVTEIPDHSAVISRIDWARKRRNDVVHTGKSTRKLERPVVLEAINAAETLLNFLFKNDVAE